MGAMVNHCLWKTKLKKIYDNYQCVSLPVIHRCTIKSTPTNKAVAGSTPRDNSYVLWYSTIYLLYIVNYYHFHDTMSKKVYVLLYNTMYKCNLCANHLFYLYGD